MVKQRQMLSLLVSVMKATRHMLQQALDLLFGAQWKGEIRMCNKEEMKQQWW